MKKSGVSLITVLLFMLVATIAATATYKWISSAGKSSGDRMMLSEAHQASLAGLENARSWITYHGNDAGALIKQYFDNNKAPVKMDGLLHELDNGRQDYSVWLVGVDNSGSTYKLKLISTGKGRNGSRYSEISILRVDGLYRLQVPGENSNVDFNEAFYGNLSTAGTINANTAIITQTPATHNGGGQALNEINVSDYLILDGDFYVNNEANIGDLYVTGDLGYCKDLKTTGNIYVGGTMYAPMPNGVTIGGSAYLQGGLNLNSKSPLAIANGGCSGAIGANVTIAGNVTMNGPLIYLDNNTGWSLSIGGSLVANQGIDFPSAYPAAGSNISVTRNVYVGPTSDGTGTIAKANASRTSFGTTDADKVYVVGFTPETEDGNNYAVSNDGNIYTLVKGNWTIPSNEEIATWNADQMTDYGDRLVADPSPNCTVKQPIQFNEDLLSSPFKHDKNHTGGCDAAIWTEGQWIGGEWVKKVNDCYGIARAAEELYNGTWLILETSRLNSGPSFDRQLDNHIIWIHTAASNDNLYGLPPTTATAEVMMYLPAGLPNGGICTGTSSGNTYNYFVFSEADIGCFQMDGQITGSVFMAQCSQVNVGGAAHNPPLNVTTNGSNIIQDAATDAIICNYSANNNSCAAAGGGGGGGAGGAALPGQPDSYYISVAPQLRVELESQYKNNEFDEDALGAGDFSVVQPSILVMPRIIYMTSDPRGRLSDYYSVLNLNGAQEQKDANQVACNPPIPVGNSLLYDAANDGDTLAAGTYNCFYTSSHAPPYNTVPFWVKVDGKLGMVPEVSFAVPSQEVTKLQPAQVRLVVPEASRAQVSVDVFVTSVPENWTITPVAATPRHVGADGSGVYTATVPSNGMSTLFTVSVDDNSATNTSMMFQLIQPCDGCLISNAASTEEVYMSGYIPVVRGDAKTYCDMEEHQDACADQNITEKLDWPSCDEIIGETKWIVPDCMNRSTVVENNKWSCSMGFMQNNYSIEFEAQSLGTDFCDILLPVGDDNKLPKPGTALTENKTETLYASIVRRQKTLYVGVKGATSPTITVQSNGLSAFDPVNNPSMTTVTCTAVSSDVYSNYYSCPVYVGDHIRLVLDKKGRSDFSYWKAMGDDFSRSQTIYPDEEVFTLPVIHGNNTVIAYFGEVDDHCFYEDFKEFTESGTTAYMCANNDQVHCFSTCTGGTCYSSVSSLKADWRLMYPKYGSLDVSTYQEVQYKRNRSGSGTLTHTGAGPGTTVDDNFFALHRVQAGMDGTLSATFTTSDFGENLANEKSDTYPDVHFLNSGFVLRSSDEADKYLALNIFANAKPFSHRGYDFAGKEMVVQACEVMDGQVLTTSANCTYGTFALTDEQFTELYNGCGKAYGIGYAEAKCFNTNKKFMMSATLDGPSLEVSLSYNSDNSQVTLTSSQGGSAVEIDLGQLPSAGLYGSNYVENQRVGFKVASEHFRVYDITWKSDTYTKDNDCWDYPHVMCSFQANYLGGVVPKDSNVTPWVSMSSWFDNNCTIEYHYNGCDMDGSKWQYYGRPKECYGEKYGATGNGYFQIYDGVEGDGNSVWYSLGGINVYKNNLTKLADGKKYNFNSSGQHGVFYDDKLVGYETQTADGYFNSAYVIVNCPTNYPMQYRTDNCNSFWVGDLRQCTEDLILFSGTQSCSASDVCAPALTSSLVNLRDADLRVSYTGMSQGSSFKVWAVDQNTTRSAVIDVPYSRETGTALISMDQLSDADAFDPETITDIYIQSSDYVSITAIESVCPYTTGIANCRAEYDGAKWLLHSTIKNAGNAKGCKVERANSLGSGLNVPWEGDCPNNGEFTVSEANLYESINQSGSAMDYQFKITITNVNDEEWECETDTITVSPLEIDCELTAESVVQGAGVPDFKYSIQNCPASGCPITIFFGSDSTTGTYTRNGGQDAFNASSLISGINTSPALAAGSGYTYAIHSLGGQSCSRSFTVEAKRDASASNCRVEGTTFKADIDAPNFGTANATLHMTDMMGNVIGSSQTITTTTTEFSQSIADLIGNPGTYVFVLSLDGENAACTATHIVDGELKAVCPAPLTDQVSGNPIIPGVVAQGCNAGCHWWIKEGSTTIASGNAYTSGLTYTHSNVEGQTKTYTFEIKHDVSNEADDCTFDVTYRKALNVACPGAMTGKTAGDPISIPAASIEGCEAANSCTWSVTDGVIKAETNYGGSGISFTHDNAIGARTYNYHVTVKRDTETKICDISVGYAPTATLTLTDCSNLTNQTPSQNVSISPTITGCGSACTWTISGAASANGQDISDISFNPGSGTDGQTKAYTLTLSREGAVDVSCPFTVTYKELGLTCPTPITDQDPSTDITVPLTATGCESNCSLNISGNGVNKTESPYNTGNVTFSQANGRGTKNYTITLSRPGYRQVICPLSVSFIASGSSDISATCAWINGPTYITQSGPYFKANSFSGYSQNNIKIYLYDENGDEVGKDENFYAPSGEFTRYTGNDPKIIYNAAGTYTYTLKDVDGYSICTADLEVKNPTANCSVTPSTVIQNNAVEFKVDGNGGWSPNNMNYVDLKLYLNNNTLIKSWDGNTWGGNTITHSYTPPTTPGSYKFTLKGFNNVTLCEKTVTVTKPRPICSVNDKSVQAGSGSFSINPSTSGCSGGCSYTITQGGSTEASGSNYYDNDAISGLTAATTASSTPVHYILTLTDQSDPELTGNCGFDITYTSGGGGSVTNEGSINCQFSRMTLNLGESFTITPNYGGSCWNGTLKLGGNSVNNNQCINGTSIVTPESAGTLTYTYAVTNGSAGNASCSANVTVNDVVVTGSVDLAKGQSNVSVPCRKQIHLTGQCNDNSWGPFNLTIQCTGSFNKTVGTSSGDMNNSVTYNAGNAYTGMDVYVSTECLPGRTMTCQAYCNW